MQAHLAKRFKGLEPLIAAIILIAVTLVIAIAVVAWLTGLFGTTVGGAESLVILPNATLTTKTVGSNTYWVVNVSIRNTGSSPASVVAVYVAKYYCNIELPSDTKIDPGGTIKIDANCGLTTSLSDIVAGVRYTVKVVTAAGNTFYTEVIAG